MDTIKIGKFIQEQRKSKKLTQLQLAIKIGVSEKTISKWECGKGLPDASLMLPLCKSLNISANELLSGEKLSNNEYKDRAEENILILKASNERNVKNLLSIEWVLGTLSSIIYIFLLFCASFAVENIVWRIATFILAFISLLIGVSFALRIEQVAGFYECAHCHHKYIPKYSSIFFAPHYGRTRFMKCPKCNKRTWNKKTISSD